MTSGVSLRAECAASPAETAHIAPPTAGETSASAMCMGSSLLRNAGSTIAVRGVARSAFRPRMPRPSGVPRLFSSYYHGVKKSRQRIRAWDTLATCAALGPRSTGKRKRSGLTSTNSSGRGTGPVRLYGKSD
jgi:hypothetical protein